MRRSAPSRRLELEPHRVVVSKAVVTQPRNSPDAICVICLDRIQHKCYLNNCLHQFCFSCLEKWSEVKSVCPLCQQKFEYALHNVRSDKDYDMHVFSSGDVENSPFRVNEMEQLPIPEVQNESEDNSYVPTYIIMVDFRRYVYENCLLSMPLRSNSRNTACIPQFIRLHQQEIRVRLIPWLNRELGVVISIARAELAIAIERVLSLSGQWHMLSSEFRNRVAFCTDKPDLFSWELYNFTASCCSMVQFDDEVRYVIPSDLEVPPHFQQFCASVGTTNPMLSLVGPSLALSPTVQSPVRSVPSPVGSTICSSDTDSEDDPNVSLHFKTVRHRLDCNGVELDSLRSEELLREQAAGPAKFYTELGGWTSDTSDYGSESTQTTKMQHRKKKSLRKTKSSRWDSRHKLVKKVKCKTQKLKKRSKGKKSNFSENMLEATTSNCLADSIGARGSNHCKSLGIGRDQDVPSKEPSSDSVTRNSVHVKNKSSQRSKRTRLYTYNSSSEDSDMNYPLSRYRKRCMRETPLSYYHGGFVPISYKTGGTFVGNATSSVSGVQKFDSKRLSSVIVKPATS